MREQDRAILCEMQPDEAKTLKSLFSSDARFGVHHRDGYAALPALVPPKERRGLVLIDPPFEAQDDEFRAIETALDAAIQRWPAGIYAVWYPIKLRQQVLPFKRWFERKKIPNVLNAQLLLHPDNSALRLNGCGMVIVNPPWKFDQQLDGCAHVIARTSRAGPLRPARDRVDHEAQPSRSGGSRQARGNAAASLRISRITAP